MKKSNPYRSINLVVIDNNVKTCKESKLTCETAGFNVQTFTNGESVLETFSNPTSPIKATDVFLISDRLPGISSFDLLKFLRQQMSHKPTPFFIITDDFNANIRSVLNDAGAFGWIEKPVETKPMRSLATAIRVGSIDPSLPAKEIKFEPKFGSLGMSVRDNTIFLVGTVEDNAWFERIEHLAPEGERVRIDWEGVTSINIEGVKAWKNYVTSQESVPKFEFLNCPASLIEMMNICHDYFDADINISSCQIHVFNRDNGAFKDYKIMLDQQREWQNIDAWQTKKAESEVVSNRYGIPFGTAAFNDSQPLLAQYLNYFSAVNQNACVEIEMTRNTVLDQSSRILARFSAYESALRLLGYDDPIKSVNRRQIVPMVLNSYSDILERLECVKEVVDVLRLKWYRFLNLSPHGQNPDFRLLVEKTNLSIPNAFLGALIEQNVFAQEKEMQENTSLEALEKLTESVFKALLKLFKKFRDDIQGTGSRIITHLNDRFDTKRLSNLSLNLKENVRDSNWRYDYQRKALLWWTSEQYSDKKLRQESDEMLIGAEKDFERAIISMMSHDLVMQLTDHRIAEIELLLTHQDSAIFFETVKAKLVTIIEKSAFSFHFNHDAAADNSMSTDEIVFLF